MTFQRYGSHLLEFLGCKFTSKRGKKGIYNGEFSKVNALRKGNRKPLPLFSASKIKSFLKKKNNLVAPYNGNVFIAA